MKIQESAENYLETILILHNRKGYVRSTDIANELSFSKPSVSVAMKNLRTNDYIVMDENGFISLTDKGIKIASSVYEKHPFFPNGSYLSGSTRPPLLRMPAVWNMS